MSTNTQTALLPAQERFIAGRIIRFSDTLNATGLYTYLKESGALEKSKSALGDVITGLVEQKLNERFHKSLGFFEKLGFLSDTKLQQHGSRVAFAKGAADFATRSMVDLIPMVVEHVQRAREFARLADFFVAWLAYVNRTPSLAVRNRVIRLYEQNHRGYNNDWFVNKFEESVSREPGKLPPPPGCLSAHPDSLYVTLLGACDLADEQTRERAKVFGDHLGLQRSDIERHVGIALDGTTVTSDLTGFAGFSMEAWFGTMAENLDQARSAAFYSIENDPFQAARAGRRKMVLQGAVIVTAAALTLATGPAGDAIITAAAPIVLKAIATDPSPAQVVEVHRKFAEVKRQTGSVEGPARAARRA